MVLAAGYLGFGALANGSAFPLWAALLSTLTIFALPGQLAMLEMSIAGTAPLIVVIPCRSLQRGFWMTVALLPTLRSGDRPPWRIYAAVHLLAMTGWAASMRRCPDLPQAGRLPWFVGFAFTNWVCCLVATAVGYSSPIRCRRLFARAWCLSARFISS